MTDTASSLLSKLEAGPERCGIVTREGEVVEIDNIHEEPEKGFHIEPKAFLAAVRAGAAATWHTHPGKDPNLSEEDMAGFLAWPTLEHHIVGIRDGKPVVHSFAVKLGRVVSLA